MSVWLQQNKEGKVIDGWEEIKGNSWGFPEEPVRKVFVGR